MEFRKAAAETRAIWAAGNEYITKSAPWTAYKTSVEQAAVGIRTGLNLVALFVSFDDKLVRLRKQDEQVVAVPMEKLSEADQKFVLEQQPDVTIDLPPGVNEDLAQNDPGAPQDPEGAPQPRGGDEPLFKDGTYNPPASKPYVRAQPGPKYPLARPRIWTPGVSASRRSGTPESTTDTVLLPAVYPRALTRICTSLAREM